MSSTTESVDTEDIDNLLKEVAKTEGFTNYEIQSSRGSVKGGGYTGIIINICITGEDETQKDKILHLIVKSAPRSEALRKTIPLVTIFEREIYMYDTVFPALHTLEIKKKIPILRFAPQFYNANATYNSEFIVLENLKESGYVLYNARSPMNEQHVSLVLTKYARLHGLSLVLKDQNEDEFTKIVKPLQDILIKFLVDSFLDTFLHRCTRAKESLDLEVNKEVIQCYNNFIDDIPNYLKHICKTAEEYSVILHGDCWCNNMMFKYYDHEDLTNPSDVRLLDFQVSKVGSPALDLCYFFYSCSSKEVLDNLDYFMHFYHKKLSDCISELGSDPEKLFPYHILKEHWKKYSKFGLILAGGAIHAMLTEREETIDLSNLAESEGSVSNAFNYEIANVDEYNKRLKNIILHFYEHNLL